MPWPSFPSFVRDAQKRDAVPVLVPLDAAGRIDLAAVRAAVTPRTRLLFVATPNNPTGRAVPAQELIALVRDLPEHVLPVIDEAYFDYLDPADRFDAITDLVRAGDDVLALRTFSKLYGLAGLRVGYGVGPAAVMAAIRKVQRGYDVGDARPGCRARKPRGYGRGGAATGGQSGRRRRAHRAAAGARPRAAIPTAPRTSSSSRSEPTRTPRPQRCSPQGSACSPGGRSARPRHCGSVRARRRISSSSLQPWPRLGFSAG